MDQHLIRRSNALRLFQDFAAAALAAGLPPKGLDQGFAVSLQISPSMWSQIKAGRPIGDKLARQIEQHTKKPKHWLDSAHADLALAPAELALQDLALQAWRASDRVGRQAIRKMLKQALEQARASDVKSR